MESPYEESRQSEVSELTSPPFITALSLQSDLFGESVLCASLVRSFILYGDRGGSGGCQIEDFEEKMSLVI